MTPLMGRYDSGHKLFDHPLAPAAGIMTAAKRHKGSIIAIDPKTGKYVLGKDELAVALKAKEKFPGTHFSVFRIGYPTVHKFRRKHP